MLVEPKTEQSRRTLSLPPVLVSALKAHKRRQNEERQAAGPKWKDHGLVFPSTVGTPQEPGNLVRNYKAALQRAELPESTRFHDLRHTAASLLVAQGVHPRVVMEILGHSQIALTLNTYDHVMSESQREALAHMDQFFPETRETVD
jgi:integrase